MVSGVGEKDNKILIFDTTLRDGEQSPGYSMNAGQKLQMAHAISDLGVDILEAGFAAASRDDFDAIHQISCEVTGPVICSMARCVEQDLEAAGKALKAAKRKRINVLIASSPLHRKYKLKMSRKQILERAIMGVQIAREWTDDVEFTTEDAVRTERDYLVELFGAAIEAGATIVTVPDTVGYATPDEIFCLFEFLKNQLPDMDRVLLSTHCHNDLGLAVANSLAAVKAGARQVECTINGIGERAGNASLEEFVMAAKTRNDFYGFETGIDSTLLNLTSKLLCNLTGTPVARNKAIVGRNAFAHGSGIHQHGLLQNKKTYEIMRPQDVGVSDSDIVLGKHSGRHAVYARAKQLGFDLKKDQLQSVLAAIKDLAKTKKEITDSDLKCLISGEEPDNRILIFDTTLRDGEQSPGFSLDVEQKVRMARALSDLGVDVIEAGFAAASPGDFEAVHQISRETTGATVCSLARCVESDIEKTARALEPAKNKRIHVFIATSPLHRDYKLKMSRDAILKAAVKSVQMAKKLTGDIEFSAEDAIRTEPDYLLEIFNAVIEAGATTLNVPDTVGYSTPEEISEIFTFLGNNLPLSDHIILSTHCHNDLGMAVANSLAAVRAGARQIECTINGIGERAGNAALEEIVMALKTRKAFFGMKTAIKTTALYPTSRLLGTLTGNAVSRNKAIVGPNAFAHEAGIHQHGVLQKRETYEIMNPEDVGIHKSNLVLGKHSGRHAIVARAKELGFELPEGQLQSVFEAFKELTDKKKEVTDADLEALILGEKVGVSGPWKIKSLDMTTSFNPGKKPHAVITLTDANGFSIQEEATGDGPMDAIFKAIEHITGINLTFENLSVRSVSRGEDALGEANILAHYDGQSYNGRGVNTDIVVASATAFLEVINRITRRQQTTVQPNTLKTKTG